MSYPTGFLLNMRSQSLFLSRILKVLVSEGVVLVLEGLVSCLRWSRTLRHRLHHCFVPESKTSNYSATLLLMNVVHYWFWQLPTLPWVRSGDARTLPNTANNSGRDCITVVWLAWYRCAIQRYTVRFSSKSSSSGKYCRRVGTTWMKGIKTEFIKALLLISTNIFC